VNTQKLGEAIEHLESAETILKEELRNAQRTDIRQAIENTLWDLRRDISRIKNEMHYVEKEKLTSWIHSFRI
jgi:hypothetical protein